MTIQQYIEKHNLKEKHFPWLPATHGISDGNVIKVFINLDETRCVIFNETTGTFRVEFLDILDLWSEWHHCIDGADIVATRLF